MCNRLLFLDSVFAKTADGSFNRLLFSLRQLDDHYRVRV